MWFLGSFGVLESLSLALQLCFRDAQLHAVELVYSAIVASYNNPSLLIQDDPVDHQSSLGKVVRLRLGAV